MRSAWDYVESTRVGRKESLEFGFAIASNPGIRSSGMFCGR